MNNEIKLQTIEEYNGLINKYVNIYFKSIKGNDISKDDLKQEIILGLLKDLDKLDESKGKSVFIEKSIENSCLRYITTRNRIKRGNGLTDDSLDRKIINEDENVNLIDVIKSDYDLEYDTINNIMVKDILNFIENNFKVRDTEIVYMYSQGYNFEEIAKVFNISKQRVNIIYHKIIKNIKSVYAYE